MNVRKYNYLGLVLRCVVASNDVSDLLYLAPGTKIRFIKQDTAARNGREESSSFALLQR